MLIRVLAVVLSAMESGAIELHGGGACESGEIAGGDSLGVGTASAGGDLGTVMRHYLYCGRAALAPLVHACGMLVSPDAALLITLSRLALTASTSDICAAIGAVAMATVTLGSSQKTENKAR